MGHSDLARHCRLAASRLLKFADQLDELPGAGTIDTGPIKRVTRFCFAVHAHALIPFVTEDAIPYAQSLGENPILPEPA